MSTKRTADEILGSVASKEELSSAITEKTAEIDGHTEAAAKGRRERAVLRAMLKAAEKNGAKSTPKKRGPNKKKLAESLRNDPPVAASDIAEPSDQDAEAALAS